jgi:hypothetical protein
VEVAERAEQLAVQVLGPLVLGGSVEPVRPFGPELALQVGEAGPIGDAELRSNVDQARLRQARRIVPVDVLTDLEPAEWTMAAAFNDLLQVTNEELSSFATRSRHTELLRATQSLCDRLPSPVNLQQAVARHATFRNLLEITRTDTHVSWWTGSAVFRGQPPATRLMRWPRLRRVNVQKHAVPLADMAAWAPVDQAEYHHVLSLLLGCSPLTDLATAWRSSPPFFWTRHTLAIVTTHPGCNLALRAISRYEPSTTVWLRECARRSASALGAFQQATARLPHGSVPQKVAAGWLETFTAAVETWSAAASAA